MLVFICLEKHRVYLIPAKCNICSKLIKNPIIQDFLNTQVTGITPAAVYSYSYSILYSILNSQIHIMLCMPVHKLLKFSPLEVLIVCSTWTCIPDFGVASTVSSSNANCTLS